MNWRANLLAFVRICRRVSIRRPSRLLSVGKSVLADVDSGVAHDCRHMFIDALAFCKAALFPTPSVILVLGDARNRRGACAPSPSGHYGVSIQDLDKMHDRNLKCDLQDAAEHFASLTENEALENLASWSTQERPPSLGHALAMEAAIILLTRSRKFRGPDRTVTAVAWLAARRLLARPVELVAKLRDFDAATIPPQTLVRPQRIHCARELAHHGDHCPRRGVAHHGSRKSGRGYLCFQ